MTDSERSSLSGLLIVNKPGGWTSHDVVARLRRLTGERRIGHAGTLDPLATGVLPVAIGPATRLLEYLTAGDKAYRAEVRLGQVSDTDDADGAVLEEHSIAGISEADVRAALAAFVGDICQRPPVYSAIKLAGTPLHRLARAGRPVIAEARPVTITSIDVVAFRPPLLTLDVRCSKGTYIRSLARDLGAALGCGALLAGLCRTRTGLFSLDAAHTLDEIVSAFVSGRALDVLLPPEALVAHLQVVRFTAAQAYRLATGREAPAEAVPAGELRRAEADDGTFIGIVRATGGNWQPVKMLLTPDSLRPPA